MVFEGEQFAAEGEFEEGNAFLDRAAGDAEEVFSVGFREAAVAFGDVGGDGEGGAVELVGEEAVAAGEGFGSGADLVCEIDGSLVDDEFLEGESHRRGLRTGAGASESRK